MSDLKICRICLRTEAKMYKYDRYQLKYYCEEVMALKVDDNDGLPQYYCYECATMLHKFHKFKEKCYIGQKTLKQLLWTGPLTYELIYKIDRASINLKSPLSIMKVTDLVKKYVIQQTKTDTSPIKYEQTEPNDAYLKDTYILEDTLSFDNVISNNDEVISNSTLVISNEMLSDKDISNEMISKQELENKIEPASPEIIFVDTKKEAVKLKSDFIKEKKKIKGNALSLDSRYWITITLKEEQAVSEFRRRSDNKQYTTAAYKCNDCFRGFSKEDMLKRHIHLRHGEAAGSVECRFCHMRFKYKSYLSKHMTQHYVRYECLRCNRIYPFENSALMHEEYHSGVTTQCKHCNIEFRHKSTYYSHMRTHRSDFVCTLCGSSYVSERGLKNHLKVIHTTNDIPSYLSEVDVEVKRRASLHAQATLQPGTANEVLVTIKSLEPQDAPGADGINNRVLGYLPAHFILILDSPDDEEDVNTYCEKCCVRFETRKAYEEHLFHSAMHAQQHDGITVESSVPKKILGKKEKAKITKELRKRKEDLTAFVTVNSKRKKREKRIWRKPTTCHQCGLHFDTQTACLKHHLSEHPRTSFFPSNVRHICEICGASLAPSSVAMHQNIHTREKVHTCDTCGKQFHSAIGLRRHLVTHTGEKRFGCPLCDKRFTQSNSMKLHYRTSHLKEPYPKRTRKKNKNSPENAGVQEESISEQDSDSLPEPEINSMPEQHSGIEPVTDVVDNHIMSSETMQYMPL